MKTKVILPAAILILLGAVGYFGFHTHKPHSVALSWHAPAPQAGIQVVGYNIYRGTSRGGPYAKIASRVPGLTYNDQLIVRGRAYSYVVTTVDQRNRESGYSTEVTVVIP
jgi:fibronectin type 3 domain-containing protein